MKRFLFYTLLFALSVILRGYVCEVLWGWFVTPFWGLPSPSLAYCLGLITLVQVVTFSIKDVSESVLKPAVDSESSIQMLIFTTGQSLSLLLFGFVYHLFT